MTSRFFDIHTHLNDKRFNDDREDVLARMEEHGVWGIVVGTDRKSSQDAVTIASFAHEGIFASIGVHPTDDRKETFEYVLFAELVAHSRVVAIGECGLDYSRLPVDVAHAEDEKSRQKKLFEAQVDFAIMYDLPLMLHCRDSDKQLADAHRDVLEILRSKKKVLCSPVNTDTGTTGDAFCTIVQNASPVDRGCLRGNVHFFSQTPEIAREYFDLGFTISFTGVITFSREYDEVVRAAPLDRLMAETDCPYVTPVPHRGKRNEPIFVEEVVKKIAEIRGEDHEMVRAALVQNALRMFCVKAF